MMTNLKAIKTRILILFMGSVIFPMAGLSQSSSELANIFTQAETYYIYEEFELANPLFLMIESPENMNIKYKIGSSYLNIDGEKEKAIPYLEEAVKTSSNDSKTESFKELKAPLNVYFSLGKAYMINGEFDKALNTFQTFSRLAKETKASEEMENFEYIDHQIQSCRNAIQFKKVPLYFGKKELWSNSNLGAIIENPAVSFDGTTIVYAERRGIENALFFSKKERGQWNTPMEITGELNAGVDCSPCSLNSDGTELYLYKTDSYDGAIYSSTYNNGVWSPIKKLNRNINSKYYESHASVSADGKKLYFTSNRPGGQGNLDIYLSEKDKSGDWGPAVNIGPEINTPFNEETPFITLNDSLLYFSSEGHNSMGGYDNFKSQKSGSGWKAPSNLGFPVNSADDDKFFMPSNNGRNAYYSITTDYKKKSIFYLDLEDSASSRSFRISGKFLLEDSQPLQVTNARVSIINRITGDSLYQSLPESETGDYSIDVAPGLFRILFSCNGYYPVAVDTIIVQDFTANSVIINATLNRDTTTAVADEPQIYEKINLAEIPEVAAIDSAILVKNLQVNDEGDRKINDSEVLYFTVQVMALHKPVDVSYFKYINDMKVMYNDTDKFYRYTTGIFQHKEDAYKHRSDLIRKGYPKQIFIKKVSK